MQMSNLPRATDSELSQEDQQLLEIGKIHKKQFPYLNLLLLQSLVILLQ